jgi:hypothetical protein
MTTSIYSSYPPEFEQDFQDAFLETLKDKACTISFLVKAPAESGKLPDGAIPAPITLFPSLFPQSCFEQSIELEPDFNKLYANIAKDVAFLERIVTPLVEIDSFVQRLWQIHVDIVRNGGYAVVSLDSCRPYQSWLLSRSRSLCLTFASSPIQVIF